MVDWKSLLLAEEIARKIKLEVRVPEIKISELKVKTPQRTVISNRRKLVILRTPSKIIEINGSGTLKNLFIVAKDDFKLSLVIDNKPIFDDEFEWFLKNSQKLDCVASDYNEETGERILIFYNLPFSKSLTVRIEPVSKSLFIDEVYYLIEKEVI